MSKQLKAVKCPTEQLALTNCAIVNRAEFDPKIRHVEINGPSQKFIFSIRPDNAVQLGEIGFNTTQVKNRFFF